MRKRISLFAGLILILFFGSCSDDGFIDINDLASNNELSLNVKNNSYSFALNAIKASNLYENNVVFDKENLKISSAVNSWAGGTVKLVIYSGNNIIYSKTINGMAAVAETINGSPDKIEVTLLNFTGQTAISVIGE